MSFSLRPYQCEALEGGRDYPGVFQALEEHRSTVLVLPTGTGKTEVFVRVIDHYVSSGTRAMVIAHRSELIGQAFDKIARRTAVSPWHLGVEMAGLRAADHHRVVVASVQSLTAKRLARFDPSNFGLLVIDEAHHAAAATYRRVLDHFAAGGTHVLGVTATPHRGDGQALRDVLASVAYVYEIGDAVADGWLVPITGQILLDQAMDLSGVRTTAGDFNLGDLAEVMERAPAVALVARGVVERAGERPTIVYAVSVDQAHAIAATINALRPGAAVSIDGTAGDAERESTLKRFTRRDFQFLVNCALYTEGVDLPLAACIAVARPTKSRGLYTQMVGRGLRLLGDSLAESIAAGKPDARILDFCAAGERVRRSAVTCLDILDGNEDAEVRRRAVDRLASGGPVLIQRALEEASAEILAEQRRRALVEVDYRVLAMADPFTILGVRPRAGKGGGRPATVAQLRRLERHKIPGAEATLRAVEAGREVVGALDYHQAEEILRAIDDRRRRGLGSPRQSVQLMKHGLNPDAPAAAAKRAMDILSAHRWRRGPVVDQLLKAVPGLEPAAS